MYEIEQLAILLHKACARKSVIDTLRVLENEAVNKRDLVNARGHNGKTPVMSLTFVSLKKIFKMQRQLSKYFD